MSAKEDSEWYDGCIKPAKKIEVDLFYITSSLLKKMTLEHT